MKIQALGFLHPTDKTQKGQKLPSSKSRGTTIRNDTNTTQIRKHEFRKSIFLYPLRPQRRARFFKNVLCLIAISLLCLFFFS